MAQTKEIPEIETELLLEGIFRRYGYDFRNYDKRYLKEELESFMRSERLRSISGLQERIFHDELFADKFLMSFCHSGPPLFNGSSLLLSLRKKVTPQLRTYPTVRIWLSGNSGGEAAYALDILLKEEGLFDRSRIYGTVLYEALLDQARLGSFPVREIKKFERHYVNGGGKGKFSKYVVTNHQTAAFVPSLKKNMVFAQHQLSTDGSFNEFQVILCAELLSHFDNSLKEKVFQLFHESLCIFGFIAFPGKENLNHHPYRDCYKQLDKRLSLYQRVH